MTTNRLMQAPKIEYEACTAPGGATCIVEMEVRAFGAPFVKHTHARPQYTLVEAKQVADWLSGRDQPLREVNLSPYPGRHREWDAPYKF